MLTAVIRVLIIYLLVLFVFRLMGKRQLGQMQPFELVLTLIIADLATIPMAEISVPLLNGIVPLLTLVIIHYFLTTLTRKSTLFSKFISGKPIIVINPNGIDYEAIKKLNITIDDLFEAIRSSGYFSISDISYAIMETNGKVSVMPKSSCSPVTNEELNIKKEDPSLPLTIISEGRFMNENLKISKKDENFYVKLLKDERINSIKDVLILTITKVGEVYLQEKTKPGKTLNVEVGS